MASTSDGELLHSVASSSRYSSGSGPGGADMLYAMSNEMNESALIMDGLSTTGTSPAVGMDCEEFSGKGTKRNAEDEAGDGTDWKLARNDRRGNGRSAAGQQSPSQ